MGTVVLVLSPTRHHKGMVDFALAKAQQDKLHLVALFVIDTRVTDTLSTRISDTAFLGDKVSEDFEETIIKQYEEVGRRELEEVKQRAEALGIACRTVSRKGDLIVESLRAARETEAQAIVIARAERFDIARKLFGSAVDELREKAPCPVFIIDESGVEHHSGHHTGGV
jgi:nucleotide-binding universal stress UspA family protein